MPNVSEKPCHDIQVRITKRIWHVKCKSKTFSAESYLVLVTGKSMLAACECDGRHPSQKLTSLTG